MGIVKVRLVSSQITKISFKQALDYLRGDSDLASYTEATITSYKQMVESSYADLNLSSFVSADIVGMIDLEDSPNKYEVYDWIERDRKYDLDWFLNYFKMYMPLKGSTRVMLLFL